MSLGPMKRATLHRPGGLALLVSLGLHGAFGLVLWAGLSGSAPRTTRPLAWDAVRIVGETRLFLSPPTPAPPAARPGPVADAPPASITIPLDIPNGPSQVLPTLPGLGSDTSGTTAGSAPGSSSGSVAFFQVPARCQSVVYLIDRSVSMGMSGALDVARFELLNSLAELPATARFQVLAYNRVTESLRSGGQSGLLAATSAAKNEAAAFVRSLRPEGATHHLQALQRALELQPDVIFLVTDADDLKPDQIAVVTRQNHGRTVIHAIELSQRQRTAEDGPLRRLALGNRGTYQARGVQP